MSRFSRAFVTGASRGIGRAIAERLARAGVEVVAAARSAADLEDLAAAFPAGRVRPVPLDVGRSDEVRRAVLAEDAQGPFDLVLANAGTAGRREPGAIPSALDGAEVEEVLRVNLAGAAATLLAGAEAMLPRRQGTLAAVTSLAGVRGMPGSGAYSASKAGLIAYLETLRADVEPLGLRVCELRPGFVRTAMTATNEFAMPALLELDDAAVRCVSALERGARVHAFPRRLAWPMRLLPMLPAGLWSALARRMHPRGKRA